MIGGSVDIRYQSYHSLLWKNEVDNNRACLIFDRVEEFSSYQSGLLSKERHGPASPEGLVKCEILDRNVEKTNVSIAASTCGLGNPLSYLDSMCVGSSMAFHTPASPTRVAKLLRVGW